jgi:hypothetical protein
LLVQLRETGCLSIFTIIRLLVTKVKECALVLISFKEKRFRLHIRVSYRLLDAERDERVGGGSEGIYGRNICFKSEI